MKMAMSMAAVLGGARSTGRVTAIGVETGDCRFGGYVALSKHGTASKLDLAEPERSNLGAF
jgi:hypothetical protein